MSKFMILLATLAAGVANTSAQTATPTSAKIDLRKPAELPRKGLRAWEFGIGASVYQFNRLPYINFTEGAEVDHIDIKMRKVSYAGQLMVARELNKAFVVDLSLGLGTVQKKPLMHTSLGLQWRLGHYFNSPWIDPYLRGGVGYMYKGYKTIYAGTEDGVAYNWTNVLNREGRDGRHTVSASVGAGVNMWLNDNIGIGLEGDYNFILKRRVANPLQGTARILFRFGGASKRPTPVVTYVDRPVEKIVEKVVEREKIVEKIVTLPSERGVSVDLNELLSSIHFDFDKHDIKPEYEETLNVIAKLLLLDTNRHWLLQGYTDSHGTEAYNQALSQRRVQAIREALLKRNLPEGMLKAYGQGKRAAILPVNSDEYARMGDRKVTIEMITNMKYWEGLQ